MGIHGLHRDRLRTAVVESEPLLQLRILAARCRWSLSGGNGEFGFGMLGMLDGMKEESEGRKAKVLIYSRAVTRS